MTKIIEELIRNINIDQHNDQPHINDMKALVVAAIFGNADIIKLFKRIIYVQRDETEWKEIGYFALYTACLIGNEEVVQVLLDSSVDVLHLNVLDAIFSFNTGNYSKSNELMRILFEKLIVKFDENVLSNYKRIVHYAAMVGSLSVLQRLNDAKIDFTQEDDFAEMDVVCKQPIFCSLQNNQTEAFEFILENINHINYDQIAIAFGNKRLEKYIEQKFPRFFKRLQREHNIRKFMVGYSCFL